MTPGTKAPRVHLIAIGAEILCGDCLETNTHEMQNLLRSAGLKVGRSTVVGDDQEAIASAVRMDAKAADCVITTGGLGPTVDDITREGVADAAGVPVREDPAALEDIERFFRMRGRELKPSNRRQALIPEGGRVLPNPVGTAPAFRVLVAGTPVYCLPGVPAEMRILMGKAILPALKKEFEGRLGGFVRAKVRLVGPTESSVNDQIADLLAQKDPEAGITVSDSVITITLASEGEGAHERVEQARQTLLETFGDRIFGEGEDATLEGVVGGLLIEKGITLALAESCTGGLMSHLLTQVPGISAVFVESAVTYTKEAKTRRLGVPEALMEKHGQVSREVAEAMAQSIVEQSGARAGVGITGIAGPGGGTPEKPVGLVHMAVSLDGALKAKMYRLSGDRGMIKNRSARLALDLLRRCILGLE